MPLPRAIRSGLWCALAVLATGPAIAADDAARAAIYGSRPALALGAGAVVFDDLQSRLGDRALVGPSAGWVRATAGRGSYGGGVPASDLLIVGLQGGFDLYRALHDDGSLDQAGVFVGISHITANIRRPDGSDAGEDTVYARSLGGYWTHHGEEGWYVDAVGQATWYGIRNNAAAGFGLDSAGVGLAASIEGGYPLALGGGWQIEPQAQLTIRTIQLGGDSQAGESLGFAGLDSLVGRLGARLSYAWLVDPAAPEPRHGAGWFRASLANEFTARPRITLDSATFTTDLTGPSLRFDGGLDLDLRPDLSLYASAGFNHALDDSRNTLETRLGVKGVW